MDDSVRPADGLIRVELHRNQYHFGVLLNWLEKAGCEVVRYWPGENVAHVRGPDEAVDRVAVRWQLGGWIEVSAAVVD